jgi:tetratricopeptide (TPR) repeat protein
VEELRGSIDAEVHRVRQLRERLEREGANVGVAELKQIWAVRLRAFWRLYPELYSTLAGLMVERSENFAAIEICAEGLSFFPRHGDLVLYLALSLARTGSPNQAFELLNAASGWLENIPDAWTLRARIYKDLWKLTGSPRALEQSLREYEGAAERRRGADAYYPEVNVATLALLGGDEAKAIEYAKKVTGQLAPLAEQDYWQAGSLAEALLVLHRVADARKQYAKAMELNPLPARKLTTRQQARLLLQHLGEDPNTFEDIFEIPPVICATGHVIDSPERSHPRFPATREASVRLRIQRLLRQWGVGLGYSGAAGGADIIFAETVHALGGETNLILPVDRETFCRWSVAGSGGDYVQRYRQVLTNAAFVSESFFSRHDLEGGGLWDFGNRMILGNALRRASELETSLKVLAVWDGKSGDGRGGTADMVALARHRGLTVHVIDPMDDEIVELPGLSQRDVSALSETLNNRRSNEGRIAAGMFLLFPASWKSDLRDFALPSEPFEGEFHRVALDADLRIFFASATSAVGALRHLRRALGSEDNEVGIALTAGPVRIRALASLGRNDVQGTMVEQGRSLAMRALHPPLVLASGEFVALAATEGSRLTNFEYNGRITSPEGSYAVFRCVSEEAFERTPRPPSRAASQA